MLPITRRISPYNHSSGNDITYIAMHYTGNDTDSAAGNANYFNGGDRQASAHYFVDDNSIYQVVEDYNAAWHCGDGHGKYGISNHNSIGIEMCCRNGSITTTTENNAIELVKYLMNKYGIDTNHVVRHYDASRKICPNWQANNWSRWTNFKNKLNGASVQEEDDEIMDVKNVFCDAWYLQAYPDVKAATERGELSAYEHYRDYGKAEGRKPNCGIPSGWNEAYYLANNPDVNANVSSGTGFVSGLHHYLMVGWSEDQRKNTYSNPPASASKEESDEGKETWYRVVAGSYKERANAEAEVQALKDKGVDGVFLTVFKK